MTPWAIVQLMLTRVELPMDAAAVGLGALVVLFWLLSGIAALSVLNQAPFPQSDPIARAKRVEKYGPRERDPEEGIITQAWIDWFTSQVKLQESFPSRIASVSLSGQSATIPGTDILSTPITEGLYLGSYSLRITRADAGGATVAVAINWTGDGGIGRQIAFSAISAASANTHQVSNFLMRIDALSSITYDTTVVVGGGDMQYALDIVISEVQA